MTIERAREILGPEAEGKTDEQIENLIARLDVLAEIVIEVAEAEVQAMRKAS